MKLLSVTSLAIPDVKVLRFARFSDHRGYFTEHFRLSDFQNHPELGFLREVQFVQCNESLSRPGTLRGLHFQWNPYVGKLVRAVAGRLVDLVLDIRLGSKTLGKILAYDLPAAPERDFADWIWVPPGFAHGTLFPHGPEVSVIEYFCTGQYNPACEASISPLAPDIEAIHQVHHGEAAGNSRSLTRSFDTPLASPSPVREGVQKRAQRIGAANAAMSIVFMWVSSFLSLESRTTHHAPRMIRFCYLN